MVSSAFNILFLSLSFFFPLFFPILDYSGPIRQLDHFLCRLLGFYQTYLLSALHSYLAGFTTCTFSCTFFFFFFLITIPQGLLFVYVSYSVLQSAIRGISVSQIAHCCWLCTFNVLLPGFQASNMLSLILFLDSLLCLQLQVLSTQRQCKQNFLFKQCVVV